jgi:hypothetical protein
MEEYSAASCRRLMDMLAGWADFAETDEFAQQEFDQIAELYQASADCMTDDDVRKFVKNKIIPVLLGGDRS